MYPFNSWREEDQERFIECLEQLRASVERIKFNDLVGAPDEEKEQALGEFHRLRNTMVSMIHDVEAWRDGGADEGRW